MASMPIEPQASPTAPPARRELTIISHSSIFYWWPVWATGLVMAGFTWYDGSRMALVPEGTKAYRDVKVTIPSRDDPEKGDTLTRDVLVLDKNQRLFPHKKADKDFEPPYDPHIRMHHSKNPGVIFAIVLLIIIAITNIPLRGLWTLIVLLGIFTLAVVFAWLQLWEWFFDTFSLLQIYINAGGYLFISLVLLAIWSITVFVFDTRKYVIMTPGQVRICLAVGAGETVYDTIGMTFHKKQDDLFRHWIVGIGSGDLIIRRASGEEIDLPNVCFVGRTVRQMEQLAKERVVV
jgi:hypothetical protein